MWQFKVLYYYCTMHTGAGIGSQALPTLSSAQTHPSIRNNMHRTLPSSLAPNAATFLGFCARCISVSRCHLDDSISFHGRYFVPCRRAFYLCVRRSCPASVCALWVFFLLFSTFLRSGEIAFGNGIICALLNVGTRSTEWGNIAQERNFPNDEMHNSNKN